MTTPDTGYTPLLREPAIWSHVTDQLPDGHPLAQETVNCQICGQMVHAFNNECMDTWVETGKGNFCLLCFVAAVRELSPPYTVEVAGKTITFPAKEFYVLDEEWGLR